ncbi:MAG: glycerate kinase, partial [Dehalococcoidia bacterium]
VGVFRCSAGIPTIGYNPTVKIMVAPQAFKGSLGAFQVCDAVRDGIRKVLPEAEVVISPMADGGDGTLEVLVQGTNGKTVSSRVTGPLGQQVEALWGVLGDGRTAVIEMARASGLVLIPRDEQDPLVTTTYGTGELIRHALEAGNRDFIIGVGGSATCDGGAGVAQALGARLLDAQGRDLPVGGKVLAKLDRVDVSGMDPRIAESRFQVASDVTNPLCGPEGTAAVYSPQKGATPAMVRELDRALSHYAEILKRDLGADIKDVPGAGAAGGLSAGLMAFLNAQLLPGVDVVAEAIDFPARLQGCDLVITGEGQLDGQSSYGKTVMGVGSRARSLGIPVIVITGGIAPGYQEIYEQGVTSVMSITPGPMGLDASIGNAYQLVADATERALRMVSLGMDIRQSTREKVGDSHG